MVTVAARRELVRFGRAQGLTKRRALRMAGMSSSVLRYQRRDDGNEPLRERIVDMAHRHRRYGYRMIHLRLRHEGWPVNLKRVRSLYRLENLMVRRRKRKKVPFGERQPLLRPSGRNEVWSIDFVLDRLADGRSLKCLTLVDDCTHRPKTSFVFLDITTRRATAAMHSSGVAVTLASHRNFSRAREGEQSWTRISNG